jgi:hypothetical protein
VPKVTEEPGNAVSFDFGTYSNPANDPLVVDLLFTVTVSNQPLSDGLFVTDLGQSQETTTNGQVSTHQDIAGITVQEPAVVDLHKGVVGFNNTGLTLDGIICLGPLADSDPVAVGPLRKRLFPAIPITLTGTDAYGQAVTATIAETNGSGDFQFLNLRPGTYSVVENDSSVVPSAFLDGKDTPGSLGGAVGGTSPKFDEL